MKTETGAKRKQLWLVPALLAACLAAIFGVTQSAFGGPPEGMDTETVELIEIYEYEDTEEVILQPITPPAPTPPDVLPPYVEPTDAVINDDTIEFPMRGGSPAAWPGGIVPIVFDGIPQESKAAHLNGMDLWNYSGANVTFVHRTSESNYIRLVPTTGSNSSNVGMIGGEQVINVNYPAVITAAHEQCHSLGFQHEQSRSNRSDYIEIICENIQVNNYSNFSVASGVFTQLTPYDYNSIMHYSECKFTICSDLIGGCPCIGACENSDGGAACTGGDCAHNGRTIVTLNGDFQDVIGTVEELSAYDIADMQNGYGTGGQNKQYIDSAGLPPLPLFNNGISSPSAFPRISMLVYPNNTLWVRGGTYLNDQSAGVYSAPGVLRTHGGSAILGGG